MGIKIRFLGTGTSVGVPQIGCSCPVCTSKDPRDRRRRSGLYVQTPRVSFLVDTPPELREACVEYGVSRVQAILLTHAHMDHVAGFDDVRRFNTLNGATMMRCFAAPETIEAMHHIFPYITEQPNVQGLFRPMIRFEPVTGPFDMADVRVTPLDVTHGPKTYGYLFEVDGARVGYISDCHLLSTEVIAACRGVDLMVLNCLRKRPHPTHLNLEQALAYLNEIAPKRALTVHMCHDVSHAEYLAEMPSWVAPAYDGQEVEIRG